ncbi:conserved hypothetical protein [Pseudarthrobacter chlorophenolicus A6]|uniref:Uncharacterized protein n=1 Tax=Pseudarthrobacter chlorophenolicus (strain ATCC 700700 / DSM 12829 / CIP 107037 / JCM 12360 / KCTC 9906 / NCIMB 13794 / A6) TaxID=452863 RepID=B8HBR9_PSECP|nr:hypothetical protein [Pseudarthrobacter chlorophenolicus]ACL40457.1 conserved hypothetical protein [Pseudarthrobacter chlorophenolicus A6]SDQ81163.1 hypothetical protein SAMN04489738_2992 [Pseudarthrobacter chlorophenolicus]
MSRTGIHGGIRRSAAAAAVGAVLVLTTGVQASQADQGTLDPGDSRASATLDAGFLPVGVSLTAGPGAARVSGESHETAAAKDTRRRTPASAGIPVPASLVPAVQASLTAAATATVAPTATATATVAPTSTAGSLTAPAVTLPPVPLPDLPLPLPSGTPTTSAATDPAPAATIPAAPETRQSPAVPEQAARQGAVVPLAQAPQVPAPAAAPAVAQPSSTEGAAPLAEAVPGSNAAAGGAWDTAGSAGVDRLVSAAKGPERVADTRVPRAATLPGSAAASSTVRSTGTLTPVQSEMQTAVVWLGIGLVAVGGAAGLVYLRLRKP